MDFKILIDKLLEDTVIGTGVLYTDQPVVPRQKEQYPWYPFNGSLFLQRKGETFVGVVAMKDGRKIIVQLDSAIQTALSNLPSGISTEQLCIYGGLTVRKSRDSYYFEAAASGVKVSPRFMLNTKMSVANSMQISIRGTGTAISSKVRVYEHMLNGRLAHRYESPNDKLVTVNGHTFSRKQVTDWLEASLQDYWVGCKTEKDVWSVPPAYWGTDVKTDMRYVVLSQYWDVAKQLAGDAGVKFNVPEPTLDFEGFWSKYEVSPPPPAVTPTPSVILVIPTVKASLPPIPKVAVPPLVVVPVLK